MSDLVRRMRERFDLDEALADLAERWASGEVAKTEKATRDLFRFIDLHVPEARRREVEVGEEFDPSVLVEALVRELERCQAAHDQLREAVLSTSRSPHLRALAAEPAPRIEVDRVEADRIILRRK